MERRTLPAERAAQGTPLCLLAADDAIIERLETLANGETPALLQLETKDFAALLPALAEHPNITLGKASAVTVTKTPFKLPLRATLEANGEIVLALKDKTAPLVMVGDWVWQNHTFQPLGLPPALGDVFRAPVRVPRSQVPQFLSQHWPQLQAAGGAEANFKLEDFTLEPQAPRFLLELKGGLAQLSALLQCAYGPRIMTVGVTASDETRLAARSGSADALFHARPGRRARRAGTLAAQRFLRAGRAGEAATARAERGLELLRARIPEAATRVERDAGGTAGTQHGAEHRARRAAVSNRLGRAMV